MSQAQLSFVYTLSIFPSLLVMLGWNRMAPHQISYKWAMLILMMIFTAGTIMTPAFRDMINPLNYAWLINFVLFNQSVKTFTNSHAYSPLIQYILNKKLNKHIRTGINSILYMISISTMIIFVKIMMILYEQMMFNPRFVAWQPFNKYIPFVIMAII